MKKYGIVVSVLLIAIGIVTPVFAVPTLQLYIPDATYYEVNPLFPDSQDSWVTTDNPFELQVAGATTPAWVQYIDNAKLYISLLEDEYLLYQSLTSPFITVKDNDPNISLEKSLYASDFLFGMPSGISYHSIYPTYYGSINLPNLLVDSAGETVYDYNKDFNPQNPDASGKDSGDIQYYTVNYDPRFTFIHFDATGTAHNGKTKDVFAPYSHDADSVIPEPASLVLLSGGLVGLAAFGRTRRKRV